MGHRALLAYRRDDTDDERDHSTATSVEETAASGTPSEATASNEATSDEATYDLHRSHWGGADFALLGLLSADDPFAGETAFAVDSEPIVTDCSLAEIVGNYLDFLHHEAFYRVESDFETTAFHVCWFGLEADTEVVERSETVGHGALVEACHENADYLRGWFRGTKTVVGDMVERGCLLPDEATDYLAERTTSWDDGREVMLPD
jgi:hypothetical protein